MCSFPDLVILERSLTVAAQCFGAAIHDALHMIYTRHMMGNDKRRWRPMQSRRLLATARLLFSNWAQAFQKLKSAHFIGALRQPAVAMHGRNLVGHVAGQACNEAERSRAS